MSDADNRLNCRVKPATCLGLALEQEALSISPQERPGLRQWEARCPSFDIFLIIHV